MERFENYKITLPKGKNNIFLAMIVAIMIVIICVFYFLWQDIVSEETAVGFSFAYQDRIADAASIIAVKKGFFKREGLRLRPMIFSSGPACSEALTYGNAQFGTMGDSTAVIIASAFRDAFKIICSQGGGEHRHRIIVSKKSNIKSINELKGKKIGVKKGTSTHGGLMLFARKHNINLNDEIVDMIPSLQLTALAAGELDAIVASEPTPSQAEAEGYGHEFCTLGGLNNTYPILIFVNSKFADKHPDIIKKMLKSMKKAVEFIKNNRNEAVIIIAKVTNLDPAVVEKAMSFHYYDISITKETINSLNSTAVFLKSMKKIDDIPDFNKIIDSSYLERL